MLGRARSDYPMVTTVRGPRFNTRDGYIGFMLDFFRRLRREGRLVFLCLHPHEHHHLEIVREICDRCMFVLQGRVSSAPDFTSLIAGQRVRSYLGHLVAT